MRLLSTVVSTLVASSLLSFTDATVTPIGGPGGTEWTFECPPESVITQISGYAGIHIDSIAIMCSNGQYSETIGGSGGDEYRLPENKGGYKKISIWTGPEVVESIAAENNQAGGTTGTKHDFVGARPDCPATGVVLRYGVVIDAIAFTFRGCDSTTTTDDLIGGTSGSMQEFECNTSAFVTQITGRAGTAIDNIKLQCSDGETSSTIGGSGGTEFSLPSNPEGIKEISITYNNYVNSIKYGDQTAGGSSSSSHSFSDPNGCPVVGVRARTDTVIAAIQFIFRCPDGTATATATTATATETTTATPIVPIPTDLSGCDLCDGAISIQVDPYVISIANALQFCGVPAFANSANAYAMAVVLVKSKNSGDADAARLCDTLLSGAVSATSVSAFARASAHALAGQRITSNSSQNSKAFASASASASASSGGDSSTSTSPMSSGDSSSSSADSSGEARSTSGSTGTTDSSQSSMSDSGSAAASASASASASSSIKGAKIHKKCKCKTKMGDH